MAKMAKNRSYTVIHDIFCTFDPCVRTWSLFTKREKGKNTRTVIIKNEPYGVNGRYII